MSTEARELAQRFGVRMCDENGMTHGEELYCFGLDDIIAMKEALAKQEQGEPVRGVYWKCVLCGFAHIEDECPECGHHTRAEFAFPQPQQRKPLTMFDTEKLAKQCGVEWTTRIDKLCKLAAAHGTKVEA